MKIALYAGSFNPLHDGHMDIARQAVGCFDRVVIVKGQNLLKDKNKNFNKLESSALSTLHGCSAHYRPHSTIKDMIEEFKPQVIVKGIRNHFDLLEAQNYIYTVRSYFNEAGIGVFPCTFAFFMPTSESLLFTSSSNERQKLRALCLHKR